MMGSAKRTAGSIQCMLKGMHIRWESDPLWKVVPSCVHLSCKAISMHQTDR